MITKIKEWIFLRWHWWVLNRIWRYSKREMIDFANWYGENVYISEGNFGNAIFKIDSYIKMTHEERQIQYDSNGNILKYKGIR